MVSREVPKLFEAGRNLKFNERSYKLVNIFGLIIMFPFCVVTAYYRGMLTFKSSDYETPSYSLVKTV